MSAQSVDTATHARTNCKREIWNSALLRQSPTPTARHTTSHTMDSRSGQSRLLFCLATFFSLWFDSCSHVLNERTYEQNNDNDVAVVLRLLKIHRKSPSVSPTVPFPHFPRFIRFLFCFVSFWIGWWRQTCFSLHLKWLCLSLALLSPLRAHRAHTGQPHTYSKGEFAENEL